MNSGIVDGGKNFHSGKIAIFFVLFLLAFIVIGTLYLLWIQYGAPPTEKERKKLVRPYNKTFIFEVYTLLPDFQKGKYESRVVVGGQTYPPTTKPGLRWDPTVKAVVTPDGKQTFIFSLQEGQGIRYTIYNITTQVEVFVSTYSVNLDDMKSAKTIYLCDGAIVTDLKFISNFMFRFDGDWAKICGGQPYTVLSWTNSALSGHNFATDDHIPCITPPTMRTIPFTYNLK